MSKQPFVAFGFKDQPGHVRSVCLADDEDLIVINGGYSMKRYLEEYPEMVDKVTEVWRGDVPDNIVGYNEIIAWIEQQLGQQTAEGA